MKSAMCVERSTHVIILASAVNLLFLYCLDVPKDALRNAISSQVARLLKEEREERGISLNALAQKSGLSRQTISYVEQEVQSPSLDTLLRLTLALDVDLADIIKRAKASSVRK